MVLWVGFWFQPTLSRVHLSMELDQLLRVTRAQSRCFWCQIIFTFFWSVSCVEGWMHSRYMSSKRWSLVLWMYPSCFLWLPLRKLGGISRCVGSEWAVGWVSEYVRHGWLRVGMKQVGGCRFLSVFACICAWSDNKACGILGKVGGWAAFPE